MAFETFDNKNNTLNRKITSNSEATMVANCAGHCVQTEIDSELICCKFLHHPIETTSNILSV